MFDIFTLSGREFVNEIITLLKELFPGLVLVRGKPRHSQSQGSVERANQDVENLLAAYLRENNTTKWAVGLKFIQLQKNGAYHRIISQTPYSVLFGQNMRFGVRSGMLPK